jgi:hypothetical protein
MHSLIDDKLWTKRGKLHPIRSSKEEFDRLGLHAGATSTDLTRIAKMLCEGMNALVSPLSLDVAGAWGLIH